MQCVFRFADSSETLTTVMMPLGHLRFGAVLGDDYLSGFGTRNVLDRESGWNFG